MKRLLMSASMLALLAGAGPQLDAVAQVAAVDRGSNVSVRERPRPEYDARGLRLGAFDLRPTLDVGVETNDNVLAAAVNEREDIILSLRPRLDLTSTWSRHALSVTAQADDQRFQDFDSESETNWGIAANGRLDVVRDAFVGVRLGRDRFHEPRTSFDARTAAAERVPADTTRAVIYGAYTFNRVRLSGELERADFEYGSVRAVGGGRIEQSQRDRTETIATARAEYGLSPDTAIVGLVRVNERDYDRKPPSVAADRSSKGQEVRVGVNTDLTKLVRGELTVGYFNQDYNDRRAGEVNGFGLEGRVEWFPTEITTVTFNGVRRVDEVDLGAIAISPAVNTSVGGRVDHELRRNVILTAGVTGGQYKYEGIDREDNLVNGDIGATWLINRNLSLNGAYTRVSVESKGAARDRDFDQNRFGLTLSLRI
jgi:hypothetical protein